MRSPHWPRALGLARLMRRLWVVSARAWLWRLASDSRVSSSPCCAARSVCRAATRSTTCCSWVPTVATAGSVGGGAGAGAGRRAETMTVAATVPAATPTRTATRSRSSCMTEPYEGGVTVNLGRPSVRPGGQVVDPPARHVEAARHEGHRVPGRAAGPDLLGHRFGQLVVGGGLGRRGAGHHQHVLAPRLDLGATLDRPGQRAPPDLLVELGELAGQHHAARSGPARRPGRPACGPAGAAPRRARSCAARRPARPAARTARTPSGAGSPRTRTGRWPAR